MNQELLKVIDIKKYFPIYQGFLQKKIGEIKAVDGVDFAISHRNVLGIVGESGSGKSTLGRAAIRLIEPTSGKIFFEGYDITHIEKENLIQIRKKIQIVFQDPYASLNPRKTIGESIGEGLIYHNLVKNKDEMYDKVAEILSLVGLSTSAINKYPHQFSGGQQQRICIGRALIMNPKLIICDESVSALDVSVQAQILNLFIELKEKMHLSYLFISHDLSVIRYISDRVLVLYLGKVMESAPVGQLFSQPKHPYTQALLSSAPKNHPNEIKKRILLSGEIPSPIHPPQGCPFRTRCPYAKEECKDPPWKIENEGLESEHRWRCIL